MNRCRLRAVRSIPPPRRQQAFAPYGSRASRPSIGIGPRRSQAIGARRPDGVADGDQVLGPFGGHEAAEVAERVADGPDEDVVAGLDEGDDVALREAERLADGFGESDPAATADSGRRHGEQGFD